MMETSRVFLFKNGITRDSSPDGTQARKGFCAKAVEAVLKADRKRTWKEGER